MSVIKSGTVIKSAGDIGVNREFVQSRNCTAKNSRDTEYIVMHYTGNTSDTAEANARYFSGNSLSASAHYFVDEKSIYQSVELCNTAWHCGTSGKYFHPDCRNSNSIGIEMCCSGNYTVSEKTIENAAQLAAQVCQLLKITAEDVETHILRHYDITRKSCPKQWAEENSAGFDAFKAKVKNLLEEGDTLMSKEYDELKAEIETLKSNAETVYRYTADIPEWGKATVQKLLDKGIFTGEAADNLKLSETMLRVMVINDRAGLYN